MIGESGCRDTVWYQVYPCCEAPGGMAVYVHTRVSDILRADPGAFRCRRFAINDTLWVDTSVVWENCHVVMGPGSVIILSKPRVKLGLVSTRHCGDPGGTRIEPCVLPWKGIYEGADAVRVEVEGQREGQVWRPVWIIGADTGIWLGRWGGIWTVKYGFFNQCGVALYKGGAFLDSCQVERSIFTWVDTADLGTARNPIYVVDVGRRGGWRSVLPAPGRSGTAAVGIWLDNPNRNQRERFVGQWGQEVYFRYLDYGIVGVGVPMRISGGVYEQLVEQRCVIPSPVADARIIALPDRGVIACPTPFRCPRGTGVCSQSLLGVTAEGNIWGRDSVWVIGGRYDTVSYGVWIESGYKKSVWEDRQLRGVRVERNELRQGRQGVTLWGTGTTPVNWDIEVSLRENSGQGYAAYGMYLLVGRIRGLIERNVWRYVGAGSGLGGIYVAGRYSLNDRGVLSIYDNGVRGYRWGITFTEGAGPVYVVGNEVEVPRRSGALGIRMEPQGAGYVLVQDNQVAYAAGGASPLHPQCEPAWAAGIGVRVGTPGTPVEVCGNTVTGMPHSFRFGGAVGSCIWRNNRSIGASQLDLHLSGSSGALHAGMVRGGRLYRGHNIPLAYHSSFLWGGYGDTIVIFYEPSPPIPSQPACALMGGYQQATVGVRCPLVRRLPPMPPPVGGIDTGVVVRAVRRGGRVSELWGAFRTLVMDTSGAILASDPALPPFYQWAQARPMGVLEGGYQGLWLERAAVPIVTGGAGMDEAEEVAARTLPLVEKVLAGEMLGDEERDSLIALALRCPAQGGPLVYTARMGVELLRGDVLYSEACEGEAGYRVAYEPSKPVAPAEARKEMALPPYPPLQLYIRLLPNPADLTVLVEWGGSEESGEVQIYDMQGRRVMGWETRGEGQRRLVVVDWGRGLYRVVYRSGGRMRSENLLLK